MNVAVYGASDKKERYSYLAFSLLREEGHTVYPIHPLLTEIEGVPVLRTLADIKQPIDTVTLYVGPARQHLIEEDLLQASVRRVIFNPGTENEKLMHKLQEAGVEVVEACSLVMLRTKQW